MDKLRKLSAISSLRGFVLRMKSEGMNPNFAWRIILALSGVVAGMISLSAYIALGWAQDVSQTPVISQNNHSALSPEDLHDVVQLYEVKESTYKELHQNRPAAPVLTVGSKIGKDNTALEQVVSVPDVSDVRLQITPVPK